jgi:hypothetical protein
VPVATQAVEIYSQIVESFQAGESLEARDVGNRFGFAARDAFVAAGNVRAFEWCEPSNEPFRRKAFIEAFAEIAEAKPLTLPPGDVPLLRS